MGGTGKHCDDVCRPDQRLCREKGSAGLDDILHPARILVFDRGVAGEQPDDAAVVEVVQGSGNAAVPEFSDDDGGAGDPVHAVAVDGFPGDLEDGDHFSRIGRRPVPVCDRGVTRGACAGRRDSAGGDGGEGIDIEGAEL